ncbi:AMP-binding protein [Alphaproteobacteria bacterium]|nr:AMP-binding protein [Alphaproteobacteria bacterium]
MNEVNPFKYTNIDNSNYWIISEIILNQCKNYPEKKIIEFVDGPEWSFDDLKNKAFEKAKVLQGLQVKQGDTITVMIDDPIEFIPYWIASSFLGVMFVALNTALQGSVLHHQITLTKSNVMVVSDVYYKNVIQLVKEKKLKIKVFSCSSLKSNGMILEKEVYAGKISDEVCTMFTSGTSGPSKGVLMPNAHCVLFAVGTIENYKLNHNHIFYISLPLFHANGLFMQLLACVMVGSKAVIKSRFSASNWLNDIRKYNVTHTNMLGAIAAFITAQPPSENDKDHDLILIGSAPLPSEAERVFRDRFGVKDVLPLYGMTEVNIPLYGLINEKGDGKCGKLYYKYFEVEIRDPETDLPLQDGEIGEIVVRPKQPFGFMSGYLGMPEKTIEAWRNFWFHTGDAGIKDLSGNFTFVDRIKDCIRRRGENISSYEVEQAFLEISYITEAAAYAIPAKGGDGMEDEVMVALMKNKDISIDYKDLLNQAKKNLATFAIPKYIRIMDNFPKTQTGKIQKNKLREDGITVDTWQNKNI